MLYCYNVVSLQNLDFFAKITPDVNVIGKNILGPEPNFIGCINIRRQ